MSQQQSSVAAVNSSHVECIDCGYDLHGLDEAGQCPECGTPINDSIRGNLLAYADREWLTQLRRGTEALRFATALAIIGTVVQRFAAEAAIEAMGPRAFLISAGVFRMLVSLVWIGGLFALTAPEPRRTELVHEDPVTLRRLMRTCAGISLIGAGLELVIHFAPESLWVEQLAVAVLLTWPMTVAAFVGVFLYYRRLAYRIPNKDLARQARVVMWGFVICYLVLLAGAIGAWASNSRLVVLPMCGALVGLVVFVLWLLRLLSAFITAFSEAQQAQEPLHVNARPQP